jgi:hypothetical protein
LPHQSAAWWLDSDQRPLRWNAILGSLALRVGPFHVYQWLGQHTLSGDRLAPLPGEYPGSTWVYPTYMVQFESGSFGVLELWPFNTSLDPDVADICRASGHWLAKIKDSLRFAEAQLAEETELAKQQQIKEALTRREVYYQAVYHAWVDLGCGERQEIESAQDEGAVHK